jgi:uncharacterized protein with HEPN domain
MQSDDLIRLRHMLDAGQKAVSFVVDKNRTDLYDDPMLAFALMKAIEIIGEAASKVSRNTQDHFKEIPWPQIVGMRNRLIHAYVDVSLDILWHTVTSNLPPLIQALEIIIASESQD